MLWKQIDEQKRKENDENEKLERDLLKELEDSDKDVAWRMKVKLSNKELSAKISGSFRKVVRDVKAKKYISNLKKGCEKFKKDETMDLIKFCPYHAIVSNFVDL